MNIFKNKGKFIVILLFSAMLLLIAACSGETSSDGNSDDSKENTADNTEDATEEDSAGDESEGLSGEIEFMTISLSPAFDDYLNNLKEEFEAKHENVTVNLRDVPYDQVEQVVLTSASSGQLSDVMNLNTDYVKKLAANGALVNMDEAAADVKDTFFEGLWETGSVEGNVYALPWYTTTSGLLYNPEILEKAGYDAPPSTFEEAWEMSEKIVAETDAYGQVVGDQMHLLLPKNGINILTEDNSAAAFNTPETIEMWKKLKLRYEDGLFPADIMLGQVAMPELYAQEKVAWWSTGPQLFRQVKDLSPEVYEKSLGGPALEGKAGIQHANPMNIAVSAKSESKETAIAFAKFVTNAKNQLEFGKLAAVLPPVKEAVNDEFFSKGKDSEDATESGKYYAAQQLEDAVNMTPPVEEVSEIFKVIREAFHKVILEDVEPADALDEAEAEVNSLLN